MVQSRNFYYRQSIKIKIMYQNIYKDEGNLLRFKKNRLSNVYFVENFKKIA